jgi:peptide/nickel transport system substrate-binding protein
VVKLHYRRVLISKTAISRIQATIIIAIIIIAAVAGGVAYYYATLPPPVQYKKTLVIAIPEEPESLDIQQVSWSNEVHDLIFQYTMNFDDQMNVVPDLATAAEFDGTSIVVHYPADAKFSNGDPITAEVLRDAMQRYQKLSIYGSDYDSVERVDVIDQQTAKIVLKQQSNYVWLNDIPVSYGAIVDAKAAEAMGDAAFGQNPVGCGPYKVKEWVQGSQVVLVRNDLYKTNLPFVQNKGPNPYIDEVIIRFIPEDVTRLSEIEAGNIEIMRGVPVDAVTKLQGSPDVTMYELLTPGIEYIMINEKVPPLDDARVRQALNFAVDRQELQMTLENTVLSTAGYMSPSMLAYNASFEEYAKAKYAYSVEKAKSLLAEAGWTDTNNDGIVEKNGQPLTLTLLIPYDEPREKRIGPLLQSQFAKAGVRVEIREFDYRYIRDQTRQWNFELAARYYSWHDPAGILPYLLHSTMANYTYSNPEVDKLLEEDFNGALEATARVALYTKVQHMLLEDAPFVPLFVNREYTAVRKNVQGFVVMPPFATIFLNDVKVLTTSAQAIAFPLPLLITIALFMSLGCVAARKSDRATSRA